MGCNCKSQNNFKKIVEKYGTEEDVSDNKLKIYLNNIVNFILTIITGILSCALFIIMAIPVIAYLMICLIIGKSPVVRIPWMKEQKRLEKKLKEVDGTNK